MHTPLSLEDLRKFRNQLTLGEIKAADIRPMWHRLKESAPAIKAEFSAMKKDQLSRFVAYAFQRETKPRMVENAYSNIQMWFAAGGGVGYTVGRETMEQAIERQLDKWTDELIQKEADEYKASVAAKNKAITNPETLDEFEKFIEHHGRRKLTPEQIAKANGLAAANQIESLRGYLAEIGRSKLTPEQLAKYEALQADRTKGQRLNQVVDRKTVDAGQLPEGVTLSVQQTKHTIKGHDLWVVQLSTRVEREVFEMLNIRAKKIGGYYSSFARNGAVPGFQFDDAGKAQRFMSMERIDGEIRVQEIQEVRQERNEQRLTAIGETLQDRGEDKLNQPRKENTVRRANMAAAAEADARRTIQVGETAVNLASAVGAGAVKFLDRLYNATQVEMLGQLLRQAQWYRIKADIAAGRIIDSSRAQDEERQKPLGEADAAHAAYPFPVVHTSMLRELIEQSTYTSGAMLLGKRVGKMIDRHGSPEMVTLTHESDRENVRELARKIGRCGGRGAKSVLARFEDCDRLQRMDIRTEPELRTALREYVAYRAEMLKADPMKEAKRELIGRDIPGFFPTPPDLAAELVARAKPAAGLRWLEPGAGMADVVDAIRAVEPNAEVDLVEINPTLIGFIETKGYTVTHRGDFLEYNPGLIYDRIVMNPPFENGQDIAHVQHAYTLLKPGGVISAIMCEGTFFRADRKAEQFRTWLAACGGNSEKNAEGAFAGSDAFRQTGTATRIVTIERIEERQAIEMPVVPETENQPEETRAAVAV